MLRVLSTALVLSVLCLPSNAQEKVCKDWKERIAGQTCDRPGEQVAARPKPRPKPSPQITRTDQPGSETRAWRRQTKVRRQKPLPKYYPIAMVGSHWKATALRLHFQPSSAGSITRTDEADKPAAIQWGGYGGRIWVIVKEESLSRCVISKRKGLFRLTCRHLVGQKKVTLVLAQP